MADSLALLCVLLFLDGATFAFFTTPLLLQFGKFHEPWHVAVFGGAASAAGSVVQLRLLRWGLDANVRWLTRFVPTREKVRETLKKYPSASFLAILTARATPLPDAPLKLVAAAIGYPLWRYGIAIWLGALPYYWVLALAGHKLQVPTWIVVAAMAAIVVGVAADRVWRARRKARA
jgi:uncharacterized membrane protein YdjX (TVP38/TMEM64 family)